MQWWYFAGGVLVAPIIYVVLWRILVFTGKQVKTIRASFVTLPIYQWPLLWLANFCVKRLRRSHCWMMTYENRWWFSLGLKAYEVKPEFGDQQFPRIR